MKERNDELNNLLVKTLIVTETRFNEIQSPYLTRRDTATSQYESSLLLFSRRSKKGRPIA